MRRFVVTASLLLVLVPGVRADAGHEESALIVEPVTLYGHNFTDATNTAFAYPLDANPPTGETPQTSTCSACLGDPYVQYTFKTTTPLEHDVEVATNAPGVFKAWIRAYQPANGAAVPPLETTIAWTLTIDRGAIVGAASRTINVTTLTPIEFTTTYAPQVDKLPRGALLEWGLRITNQNGLYNPAAAPYGVGPDFPFFVTVPRYAALSGVTLRLTADGADVARVNGPQAQAAFGLRVENHGALDTEVALRVTGVPTGASYLLRRPAGTPDGPLVVAAGHSQTLRLELERLPFGNHSIGVAANSTRGETDALLFVAQVARPPPTTTPASKDAPGLELWAALAALALALRRRQRS